jgi:hypothetical protein
MIYIYQMKCPLTHLLSCSASSEEIDDRQQDDGTHQRHQHGWNGDSPDANWLYLEQGGKEIAGYESAYDGHNNVDQQV